MLDSQFRGTSLQFVLHFNEQFRRLDGLTDLSERMPESIKITLLQGAVKDIHNSSLLRPLMNIPPQPLEQGYAHISPTHPTAIFSSMLVLGMMQPILPLPLREGK